MTSKSGASAVSVRRVYNESDRRIGGTTSVAGGVLRLDGCEPRCSIDYTLVVPPSVTWGPISLRTENGQIRGSDLAGSSLKAQSLNGDMELAVTTPQDVSVQTNNGSVALTLPDQSYAISVGVPNDPASRCHLDLSAANGDITVRPTP